MLQSCETLITKINEWQKAILELEGLSDKFLNSGNGNLKPEIENKKQEIISREKEYQKLAYPELPDGENLFWVEKELFEELTQFLGLSIKDFLILLTSGSTRIQVRNGYITKMNLDLYRGLSSVIMIDLSLFQNLQEFSAAYCELKTLPKFYKSVKNINITYNPDIQIPEDLSYLVNLEKFVADRCDFKIFPVLSKSVKYIQNFNNQNITSKEKQRIVKEYPNAVSIHF